MHLNNDELLDLAHAGSAGDDRHVAQCEQCRSALAWWRQQLAGLRALRAESIDDRELHRLRVLFRHRGPQAAPAATRWLARLVRHTGQLAPAMRGASQPRLFEFAGGPLRVVLHLSGSTVHGQVLPEAEDVDLRDATVVLSGADGASYTTDLDALGEFHLDGVRPGHYHASWWTTIGRIDVADIEVEGSAGA